MLTFDPGSHTYCWDGKEVPGVTSILGAEGFVDDRWFTDEARDRGKAVHRVCELWNRRILDQYDYDWKLDPYLTAWERFEIETGAGDWELIEHRVYHEALGYAGTFDVLGPVFGTRTLVDIKSGEPGAAAAIQTAAYVAAHDGPWCGRMAVHLMPDGRYRIHDYGLETQLSDLETFAAALRINRWKGENL